MSMTPCPTCRDRYNTILAAAGAVDRQLLDMHVVDIVAVDGVAELAGDLETVEIGGGGQRDDVVVFVRRRNRRIRRAGGEVVAELRVQVRTSTVKVSPPPTIVWPSCMTPSPTTVPCLEVITMKALVVLRDVASASVVGWRRNPHPACCPHRAACWSAARSCGGRRSPRARAWSTASSSSAYYHATLRMIMRRSSSSSAWEPPPPVKSPSGMRSVAPKKPVVLRTSSCETSALSVRRDCEPRKSRS